MGLPGVKINVLNGQLGRTPGSADGVAGLIGSGVAAAGIALGEAKQIFGTEDAKALGLNEEYDTTNSTNLYRHIKDFYKEAGEGAELWVMIVSATTTMADMVDSVGNFAPVLLNAADGRIRLLGVTRKPDGLYAPTYTSGMDDDAEAAMLGGHSLAEAFAAEYKPVRVMVEGRDFQGVVANLKDLRQGTQNRAGVVLAGLDANSKAAAVGLVLGRMAAVPVQRNIGRVKDGDLGLVNAYLSDGQRIESYSLGAWGAIHDKGYIFARKYQGRSGYYFNDDPAATVITDDYSSLARGRVIDKALLLAYTTYVNEILDDIEINPDNGQMNPAVVKSYQAMIENVLNLEMVNAGEASGVSVSIDPTQNVLSTDKVMISLAIVPKGYSKEIVVDLGFSNPANS
jgi:hypothetical protein